MSELKSCPFCGSDRVALWKPTCNRQSPYNPADRAYPEVGCRDCFASAHGKDWDETGRTAIAAWNRRASAQDAREAADAARWQHFVSHISGGRDPHGRECFVIEIPDPRPGVSIMRGSVAEHFTDAIDAALRAAAPSGED